MVARNWKAYSFLYFNLAHIITGGVYIFTRDFFLMELTDVLLCVFFVYRAAQLFSATKRHDSFSRNGSSTPQDTQACSLEADTLNGK